jgi:hypothetical protein
MRTTVLSLALLAASATLPAQQLPQAREDEYIRQELLDPGSARFRTVRDLSAVTAGSTVLAVPLDSGSLPTEVRATDRASGETLKTDIVAGSIRVQLARPVAAGGEARLRLEYTEQDRRRYSGDAKAITFLRSPGGARGSVVLPAGFRVTSCNLPAQILATPEGRVMLSIMTVGPAAASLTVRARPGLGPFTPSWPTTRGTAASTSLASQASRLNERAFQDREIVYFLNDPSTNSFSLYHDYTESRPGVGHYFNVVRAGSRVSNPSAKSLDTGEDLKVETLKGEEVTRRGLNVGEALQPDAEVVVISFPPVEAGKTTRLRITETYTDAGRYFLEGDGFVWDRAFGRPRNAIVLPAGWTAVASSIPGVIQEQADGRLRIDFNNNRPDEVQVLVRGRRTQ